MANYDMDKLVLAGFDGEHVDDTFTMEGVKIDNTLSVTGRAADAKKTGDEIGALKEDLNAFGYKHKKLTSALISSAGEIEYTTVWDVHAYKISENGWITMSVAQDSQYLVYAFYASEPSVGSSSYNASRVIASGLSATVRIPQGVTWVAIRSAKTDTPNIFLGSVNDISKAVISGDVITTGSVDDANSNTFVYATSNVSNLPTVADYIVETQQFTGSKQQIAICVSGTGRGIQYYRSKPNAGVWGDWVNVTENAVNTLDAKSMVNRLAYSGESVNDIAVNGYYYVYSTVGDLPTDADYLVQTLLFTGSRQQIATCVSGDNRGTTFYRGCPTSTGVWGDWVTKDVQPVDSPPPMLTIIDDDGHHDYLEYLLPFANSLNVPIATAVTPLRIGGQSAVGRYMTESEIKECMNNGAEVICHTYSHTPKLADIKRVKVVNGTLVNSSTFVDSGGNTVTGKTDVTYHDTTTNNYYTYASGTYSIISDITIYDFSKLIDIYTDVTGYAAISTGDPIYATKDAYYTDKLAKYYTFAKNIMFQDGFSAADVVAYNNDTGLDPIAQNAAKRVFKCGFGFNTNATNYYGNINPYHINRYGVERADLGYYDVNTMNSILNEIISRGTGWVVFTMHTTGEEWRGRTYDGRTGIGKEEVMRRLREVINYAHLKGVQIVTPSYGYSVYCEDKYAGESE